MMPMALQNLQPVQVPETEAVKLNRQGPIKN